MNTKMIVMLIVGVLVLAGLFVLLKPQSLNQYDNTPSSEVSKEKVFKIVIVDKKVSEGDSVLKVSEGDSIVIKITSDVADEVHMHGYDKSLELEKGVEGNLSFVANIAGRFEFELEKSGVELGVLEVTPKQ